MRARPYGSRPSSPRSGGYHARSVTDGIPVRSMKQLFELALQLEPPWRVVSSDIDFERRSVDLRLGSRASWGAGNNRVTSRKRAARSRRQAADRLIVSTGRRRPPATISLPCRLVVVQSGEADGSSALRFEERLPRAATAGLPPRSGRPGRCWALPFAAMPVVSASGRGTDAGNTALRCCRSDGSGARGRWITCGAVLTQIGGRPPPATVGQSGSYPDPRARLPGCRRSRRARHSGR